MKNTLLVSSKILTTDAYLMCFPIQYRIILQRKLCPSLKKINKTAYINLSGHHQKYLKCNSDYITILKKFFFLFNAQNFNSK